MNIKENKQGEYNDELHQYKFDGVVIPSVTQILKEAGLVNLDFISEEYLREKSDLGKKVHTATELYDADSLDYDDLHPKLQAYVRSWQKFLIDYKITLKDIELQMFSNLYRFAGRLDRTGWIGKELTLVDIKSGSIQHSHAIQTAGYEILYNQDKKKSEQIKRRMCVYLNEHGYQVREYKKITDRNVFLSALTISNYLRSI